MGKGKKIFVAVLTANCFSGLGSVSESGSNKTFSRGDKLNVLCISCQGIW